MMKETVLVMVAFFVSGASASAQGTLYFANRLSPAVAALVSDVNGQLLLGTGYSALLYAGSDLASLAPVSPVVPFTTQAAAAGSWTGITVTIPTVPPGGTAFLQVRAWDNLGGTIPSYNQAVGRAATGFSTVFVSAPLGGQPPGGGLPIPDPNIVGNAIAPNNMTAFEVGSLGVIPEPSALVLGAFAGLALMINGRRKRA